MTRMIAGQTPDYLDYEVYLDDTKVDGAFEADDIEGKVWVYSTQYPGYRVLKGNVEFRKKPASINQQNQVRGDPIQYYGLLASHPDFQYNIVKCGDAFCPICYPYGGRMIDLGFIQ